MKFIFLVLSTLFFYGCTSEKSYTKDDLKTNSKSEASYSYGFMIGEQMSNNIKDVDLDAFKFGLVQAFLKKSPVIDKDAMMAAINVDRKKAMEEQNKANKISSAKNLKSANEFLAKNKSKKGVKVLQEGLQYIVLKKGKGKKVKKGATVLVDYVGTLENGKEFDSSIKRGKPVELKLTDVIEGWKIAMPKMKVGSKWKLFIHPKFGYKENGIKGIIPGNSVLIFEVEIKSAK